MHSLYTQLSIRICFDKFCVFSFFREKDMITIFLMMLLNDEMLRRRRPGKLASCTVDFVYREFPFPTIQPTTSPRHRR